MIYKHTQALVATSLCALRAHAAVIDTSRYAASYPNTSTSYRLVQDYSGSDFFSGFTAFTGPDPTNGLVDYLSLEAAEAARQLGFVRDAATNISMAYLGVNSVDMAPAGRASVRLESVATMTVNSVVVADIARMPTGCGLWSAFWLLGEGTWPGSGEIDILETVHTNDHNSITLHTAPGCSVDTAPTSLFQGTLTTGNCNANDGYDGCSVAAKPEANCAGTNQTAAQTASTAGAPFNAQGGGVYVTTWTTDGIAVYLFPRDNQPADLVAGEPDPSAWTNAPIATFAGNGCDYSTTFSNLRIVINTDFCGSWAGQQSVWEGSGCKASTGVATCNDFVANHPEAFRENADWLINSVKVYTAS